MRLLIFLFLWLILPVAAFAQAGVQVLGGSITLQITDVVPGGQPQAVSNNSTLLRWEGFSSSDSKITVSAQCPGQSFNLYLSAQLSSGTATVTTQEIPMSHGMLPVNLVTGIPRHPPPRRAGEARLTYRATATAAQGHSGTHSDDVYQITFTMTIQ